MNVKDILKNEKSRPATRELLKDELIDAQTDGIGIKATEAIKFFPDLSNIIGLSSAELLKGLPDGIIGQSSAMAAFNRQIEQATKCTEVNRKEVAFFPPLRLPRLRDMASEKVNQLISEDELLAQRLEVGQRVRLFVEYAGNEYFTNSVIEINREYVEATVEIDGKEQKLKLHHSFNYRFEIVDVTFPDNLL